MVCDTRPNLTAQGKADMARALARLEAALSMGAANVVIGRNGAVAFTGWGDRAGYSDVCAYRRLASQNSPELRRAVARAEAVAGRKIDARAVAAGMHSHDNGATWGTH